MRFDSRLPLGLVYVSFLGRISLKLSRLSWFETPNSSSLWGFKEMSCVLTWPGCVPASWLAPALSGFLFQNKERFNAGWVKENNSVIWGLGLYLPEMFLKECKYLLCWSLRAARPDCSHAEPDKFSSESRLLRSRTPPPESNPDRS